MDKSPVKRKRGRTNQRGPDYRKLTYTYSTRNADGSRIPICAKAFRSIYGIGKTRVLRLSKHSLTVPLPDRRGKHNQHPKIGPEIREKVRVHISSFHKQQSHYSREQNSARCYLYPNLTVRRMWFLYLIQNEPDQITILQKKRKMHSGSEITLVS